MAFYPDGKVLAISGNDGTIKLWDIATGELRLTLDCQVAGTVLNSHTQSRPVTLVFTPGGEELLYGTSSGTMQVWRQR